MLNDKTQIAVFLIITTGIILLLLAFVGTLFYVYRKRQMAHSKTIETLKLDHEKNLLKTQVEIQEQTFHNISREIHDNISLSLTLVKLHLNTLNWENLPKASELVRTSVEILGNAITDLRDISTSLNPELISSLGLIKAIEREIARITPSAPFKINFEVTGNPVFMQCEKELVIFRIVQEAFNNIIKHANANAVFLKLDYDADHVNIFIQDDGAGFYFEKVAIAQRKADGAGLYNMQTRAKLFNGTMEISSRPDDGTKISISIPYYGQASAN